jgi:hypothetical protein
MKIIIETIPHKDQRYPTCGDWYFEPEIQFHDDGPPTEGKKLVIRVSEEMGADSCFLVAIHELVECYLATHRGVTVEEVDEFDKAYEKSHRVGGKLSGERTDDSEPGDDPKCPVFKEHGVATAIETLLCSELGIPWPEHDKRVEELP